jgi:membrane-bound lytic murein transglycosylase MltF
MFPEGESIMLEKIRSYFLGNGIFVCISLMLSVCLSRQGFCQETYDNDIVQAIRKPWKGDYGQMVERRIIRALVPFSKTFYYIDGATPRGVTYELLKEFEKMINDELKTRHLKVQVIIIPTSRDQLLPALEQGLGDIAAGNLTRTENRLKRVEFSTPLLKDVSEILVTGSPAFPINSIADLSGKDIYVRKSSSYYESLVRLNKELKTKGLPQIKIVEASELLEDEDLLEMVNADLFSMTVVDSHKGEFWAQIFDNITLHPTIKLREKGEIAWAFRKNSPELKAVVNKFVSRNKKGTLMGNILFKRYLQNTTYIKNNLDDDSRKRLKDAVPFFKKYAGTYNFDWLMLAALSYQESTIDQSKRSASGAIGVMQVLPSTAGDKNINIPDIQNIESNIHAGTKYLRFITDRYFDDPAIDRLNRALFTFASYNAGPAMVARLRKEAKEEGFNPDVWFNNVEVIAAKRIGRETVQYVSNIYKYYVAYSIIMAQIQTKKNLKKNSD